jgi:hypothetical protein
MRHHYHIPGQYIYIDPWCLLCYTEKGRRSLSLGESESTSPENTLYNFFIMLSSEWNDSDNWLWFRQERLFRVVQYFFHQKTSLLQVTFISWQKIGTSQLLRDTYILFVTYSIHYELCLIFKIVLHVCLGVIISWWNDICSEKSSIR